jgi:hypothetical protein
MIYRSPFNRSAPFKSFTEVPDVLTVPNVPVVQWLRYGTPVQMFKVRGLMAVQGSNVQKFKGRLSDVPAVPGSRRFNCFAWFILDKEGDAMARPLRSTRATVRGQAGTIEGISVRPSARDETRYPIVLMSGYFSETLGNAIPKYSVDLLESQSIA